MKQERTPVLPFMSASGFKMAITGKLQIRRRVPSVVRRSSVSNSPATFVGSAADALRELQSALLWVNGPFKDNTIMKWGIFFVLPARPSVSTKLQLCTIKQQQIKSRTYKTCRKSQVTVFVQFKTFFAERSSSEKSTAP